MSVKSKIGYCLYVLIGKRLPTSTAYIHFGQKCIRRKLAACFVKHVGQNVNIEDHAALSSDLYIGDNSGIGSNSKIMPKVKIGENVMMGPNCFICTQNHKFDDITTPMRKQGSDDYQPVTIGDDVWIGQNVIILPGVEIGSGSIIGAGAVVTKSFPSFSIIGGNPAKLIRTRSTSNTDSEHGA